MPISFGTSMTVISLPASFFSWNAVGLGQIIAWMIAGAGATFATQYIVQAIASVRNEKTAKRATAKKTVKRASKKAAVGG